MAVQLTPTAATSGRDTAAAASPASSPERRRPPLVQANDTITGRRVAIAASSAATASRTELNVSSSRASAPAAARISAVAACSFNSVSSSGTSSGR